MGLYNVSDVSSRSPRMGVSLHSLPRGARPCWRHQPCCQLVLLRCMAECPRQSAGLSSAPVKVVGISQARQVCRVRSSHEQASGLSQPGQESVGMQAASVSFSISDTIFADPLRILIHCTRTHEHARASHWPQSALLLSSFLSNYLSWCGTSSGPCLCSCSCITSRSQCNDACTIAQWKAVQRLRD